MNKLSLFGILFSAIFINNIVLMKFLGLCSFFGVSNKIKSSIGMSFAVMFVMLMAGLITWPIYYFILKPLDLVFLRTIVFIFVISTLVQLVELFMKKKIPTLFKALGIYLPLITTNCAILACAFLNIDYEFNFVQMIFFTSGIALGYTLAILLFSSIRERLEIAPIPESLKGYGIVFITAGLMSLAFMGFSGLFGL